MSRAMGTGDTSVTSRGGETATWHEACHQAIWSGLELRETPSPPSGTMQTDQLANAVPAPTLGPVSLHRVS